MTNTQTKNHVRFVVYLSIIVAMFAAVPTFTHAASYAYIDILGNIKSVTADNWMSAIRTAPNISRTSGVLLLTGPTGYHVENNRIRFGNN